LIDAHSALIRAREIAETQPEVHLNLGAVQRRMGQTQAALQSLNRAVELNPSQSEAFTNRGNLLREMNDPSQAIQDFQRALELNPMSIAALIGLGQSLLVLGHWDEAMDAVRLASQLAGSSLNSVGRSLSASLRRRTMSNLLYCASLSPVLSRDDVFGMHVHWGQAIENAVRPFEHEASADSEKRLRIGYVSPDFRSHATMRFFLPFFDAHDREQFDICCYSECAVADRITEVVRSGSTLWRDTNGLGDQQLADLIRSDRIDILIDLAGHTSGNRLPSFACRPAPIQVSFLGYPNSTGLSRMDYLLVDAIREDQDTARFFTEQLVAMPHGACCFQSLSESTLVADPPCLKNGHITFGSTHRLEKLSGRCLQLWATVLNQVPTARLRMIRDVLGTGEIVRTRLRQQLTDAGIDFQRVDLVGDIPANHLEVYSQIDILLDVFPWPSGTTVYESHWMGVPMPAIADRSVGSCASASCLFHTGYHDLIAESTGEYLDIVKALASDTERLVQLRRTLRSQMLKTVCNGVQFSQDLESVYRSMWRRYCGLSSEQSGLPLIVPVAGTTP
jgi:predicted O-linked N-acetylglucosamine transferase (SPINDLY family)